MRDDPRTPAELIRRLPATFGPALNDQFRQWKVLFRPSSAGFEPSGLAFRAGAEPV
jgi:hypothetical protein